MSLTSSKSGHGQIRTYQRTESVVFLKTDAPFGGLSNMAGRFPLRVNGTRILTSEALYQACRFPHRPEVQRLIIEQASPMTAKMKSKPYRHDSRPDWDKVRVKIMRWCLRVKLAQNWGKFSELLLKSGTRPIVEESRKDDFWGAKPADGGTLIGMNVLGRLLMELREAVKSESRDTLMHVEPLTIPDFLLNGQSIAVVVAEDLEGHASMQAEPRQLSGEARERAALQPTLFDGRAIKEVSELASRGSNSTAMNVPDLRPYAEYRATLQRWLGEIPKHWLVLPNRALFAEVKDRNHPDAEMLSVTITRGIVRQKAVLERSSKKDSSNLDKSAYKLVQPGDIAYNKMRTWQGAIGASALRGIVSPAYVVMRLRTEDSVARYFHYLYRTPQFAKEAERWSYGITSDMWSLRPEHFKMIYTPVPPPAEQAAIVRFVEWANGRLERAIRDKRKVIGLLNEQKHSIIHGAVTRGLDPSVPLKPSGVPWLGDIPRHWQVRRMSSLAGFASGKAHEQFFEPTGEHICVTARFVSTGGVLRKPSSRNVCPAVRGDVLMVMSDLPNGRALARTYLVRDEKSYAVNQRVCRLTPHSIEPRFLAYYANRSPHFLRQDDGMNQTHLSNYDFKTLPVALPSRDEQTIIADYIERHSLRIDNSISRLDREIELLREYRTRLIADVVTGKLNVREAAAQLPDETPFDASEDGNDPTDEVEAIDEEAVA
jgi:type I restriction enzyme, S subunit